MAGFTPRWMEEATNTGAQHLGASHRQSVVEEGLGGTGGENWVSWKEGYEPRLQGWEGNGGEAGRGWAEL